MNVRLSAQTEHPPPEPEHPLGAVWGHQATPSTRTVDVHGAWLRQKLEANPRVPQFILTVQGMGYKFAG